MNIIIACASLCAKQENKERIAINLAHAMHAKGHNITLLSLALDGNTIPTHTLPYGAQHISGKPYGKQIEINLLREKIVQTQADVFFAIESDQYFIYWAMICMGTGIPFICSDLGGELEKQNLSNSKAANKNPTWDAKARYAVLSGADIIHEFCSTAIPHVPKFFQEKVRVLPESTIQNQNDTQWEELFMEAYQYKNKTVLDTFNQEPFLYQARLYAVVDAEYALRSFGTPIPYSISWLCYIFKNFITNLYLHFFKKTQ